MQAKEVHMENRSRRGFVLSLAAAGLSIAFEAEARGSRSGHHGSAHSKGGSGRGGSSECGSRGGPGGPRDKNGKCPSWKK